MLWWVVSIASAALLAGLALFLWIRRPPAPLWPVLFACQIFALLWVLGDLWASRATSVPEKQLALGVLFTGSIPIAAAWWCTMRRYVLAHGLARPWLESRWARLPPWYAGVAWLFMLTNPWHGQFLTPLVGGRGEYLGVEVWNEYHWGIFVVGHVNYALVLATAVLCGWAARSHGSPRVRRRMTILAIVTLAPLAANLTHVYLDPGTRLDPVAPGMGLASVVIIYGIYRERLFSPLPIALPAILERDPSGVALLDREGRLLHWNPAAVRLLEDIPLEPDVELLQLLAERLESPADDPIEIDALAHLASDRPASMQPTIFRFVGGAGTVWLRLSLTPIASRRSRFAANVLRIEDVTELQRAQYARQELAQKLHQVEKLRSLSILAGGVAHDFNNLLTAITGNVGLTLSELPPGAPLRENLLEVQEAAEIAAALTQQLLAYAGRAVVTREAVDVAHLVDEMIQRLASSLPPLVTVRVESDRELPAVWGDPTQLRQVVMNLVTNAAQACGETAGSVRIRTAPVSLDLERIRSEGLDGQLPEGEYVLLEVSDSGCGMDEETRRKIFDPFFSTKSESRGLGLAAAFGIARAHGAAISVQSEAGRGTIFRVWLPVTNDGRPGAVSPRRRASEVVHPGASSERARQGHGTILVVDDQPRIHRLTTRILEGAGFDVLNACDGSEALELYRTHGSGIRLVLLDLTMPGMGGEEVLERILETDPDARILLMSGYDQSDTLKRVPAEKLGGFLRKPYSPAELLARVGEVLGPEDSDRRG